MLVVDTSVLIDWPRIVADRSEVYGASILSRAELEFGVLMAADPAEQAARRQRLNEWDARLEWLPVTENAARSYGLLASTAARSGAPGKARAVDMYIAAQAHALGAGLLTFNAVDLVQIKHLVSVVTPTLRNPD